MDGSAHASQGSCRKTASRTSASLPTVRTPKCRTHPALTRSPRKRASNAGRPARSSKRRHPKVSETAVLFEHRRRHRCRKKDAGPSPRARSAQSEIHNRPGTDSFLPKQTSTLLQQPDRFVFRSPTRPLTTTRGRRFPALPPLVRIDALVVKRRPHRRLRPTQLSGWTRPPDWNRPMRREGRRHPVATPGVHPIIRSCPQLRFSITVILAQRLLLVKHHQQERTS